MNANRVPGVIRIHGLRTVTAGSSPRVEAQLVVPEFWTVEEAHEFTSAFHHRVLHSLATAADVALQIQPCHRQFCASCAVEPCPIRVQPFAGRDWITLADAIQPAPVGQ
jgi:divalent metal cation (Fe/Co/Zn/Cd) transporter